VAFGVGIHFIQLCRLNQKFRIVASVALQPSYIISELLEPMDRRTGGTSAKLEQVGKLTLVEGLGHFPKPLHHLVGSVVLPFVVSVGSPVFDVNVRNTIDEHFQLKGLENFQQIHGYDFVKPLSEVANGSVNLLRAHGLYAA